MVLHEREESRYGAIRAEDERVWQAMRRCGIGGSDASVILGVNPYRNLHHLRADKRRGIKVRQNAAMAFGSIMEEFILEVANDQHELELVPGEPLGTLYTRERPWQLANVDGTRSTRRARSPTGSRSSSARSTRGGCGTTDRPPITSPRSNTTWP